MTTTLPGNSGGAFRSDDVDIEPTADTGGGYDVAWIDPGEWLEYTVNVPDPSAIYSIKARVASTTACQMRVRLDGTVLGVVQIPNTGGWQNWQTVTLTNVPIAGGSGAGALRLEMLTGGFNLNWIVLERVQICGTNNIAQKQTASASSVESGSYPASSAFDGDPTTRWSSAFSDPQWVTVDLGSVQNIARVRLNWENAFGQSYSIQLSTNSSTWTSVYTTTNGPGSINDLAALGTGRYVRMYGTQRGTSYGYSLWEFEVYRATTSWLSINAIATNAVICWPISTIDWVLESSPALGAASLWTQVTNEPVPANSTNFVTNIIGANAQFYRLRLGP